jgi:hypothetical protein
VLRSHTGTQFNSQFAYNPHVNSSTFNAAHILRPPCNVHQSHSGGADPALTYMLGYWVFVSPESAEPMQVKLQDSPAAEPGEGTKFMTVYILNKQYRFSRTQTVQTAVPINSVALKCADIPKLIQLYCYFTVPTLSDVVVRHSLQTSIRIPSLASIIVGHQCDPVCPGYKDVLIFHKLQQPRTVKHNIGSRSRFFEVTFDNSPHDDGPGVISTYSLNRHFEFFSIGDQPTVELMYGNSTEHSICKTPKITDFVANFVHLDIAQLTSIACTVRSPSVLCTARCLMAPVNHLHE